MQKDFKIGLAIGVTLAAAAVLWLATLPNLSARARALQAASNIKPSPNTVLCFPSYPSPDSGIRNTPAPGDETRTRIHVVQKGETLSSISVKYYGSANQWRKIVAANRNNLPDPTALFAGIKLIIRIRGGKKSRESFLIEYVMLKRILHQAIILLIGIVKSAIAGGLVASVTSIVIAGGDFEVVPASLLMILFLLPAMFLYHLGCVLKLRQYICDILYFVGFLSLELYFGAGIVNALEIAHRQRYSDGSEGWGIFFLYIITFSGFAVYFTELIFRNRKHIKESGYKEVFEEFRWATVAGADFEAITTIINWSH